MEAVGVDISDHAIKFVEFRQRDGVRELGLFGERPLPEGVIVAGELIKQDELVRQLKTLKNETGFSLVRSSLTESRGYLFQTTLKNVAPGEARAAIDFQLEEHVPIARAEAVFDAEPIRQGSGGGDLDFVVTVFPEKIVAPYLAAFKSAGLFLLSLELEAQAIARAVIPEKDPKTSMVVDLGETHTGVSVVSEGVVHYTSTIDIAGRSLTAALSKNFSISSEGAERMKREKGFSRTKEDEEAFNALMTTVSALSDEINRRLLYWDTHFKEHCGSSKIEQAYLCGGNANILGLVNYFAANMSVPVSIGNVWTNAFSLDTYVPPLDAVQSRRFATAVGLALRSGS